MKKALKKAGRAVKSKVETGARRAVIEQLFYDFHRSRADVFWMNFFRGIFFGVGTLLGGTVVVTLVVYLLSLLVDVPGGFGEFIQYIVDTVERGR